METVSPEEVVPLLHDLGGTFVTADGTPYYVPPAPDLDEMDEWEAPLAVRSTAFTRFVRNTFNLGASKRKKLKEVCELAEDAAWAGATRPRVQWTGTSGDALLLCLHPAQVLRIEGTNVRAEPNGQNVIGEVPRDFSPLPFQHVLPWFQVDMTTGVRKASAALRSIDDAGFVDIPPPIKTDRMETKHHVALVKGWIIGALLQAVTTARPILAVTGAYGSGKTVTAKMLGRALYGPTFDVSGSVGGSRGVKDLMATLATKPVVVRDDMNRESPQIVDALCRVATGTRIDLSTLHETLELSSFAIKSNLVVTAHTPEWAMRADLLSRMMVVRLDRPPPSNMTEEERYARVDAQRPRIWADLLVAIMYARTSDLRWSDEAQSRVDDTGRLYTRFSAWEKMIRRAAAGGGWYPDLVEALQRAEEQRVMLAIDTDPFLAALWRAAKQMEEQPDKFYTASEVLDLVTMTMGAHVSADPAQRPSARALSNPRTLGKFLGMVERDGQTVVNVERGPLRNGIATWRLIPRA